MRVVLACECGAAIHLHGSPDEPVLELWRSIHSHKLDGHGPCTAGQARLVRYAGRDVERKTHALDHDSPPGRTWPRCGGYGDHIIAAEGALITCELCLARIAQDRLA